MGIASLRFQSLSLLYAEPVLFVRNDQSQMGKHHILLNEGMGADEHINGPILQPLQDFISFLRLRLA